MDTDWTIFYLVTIYYLNKHLSIQNDPLQGVPANATNLVLGGQSCMWGETVDSSDQTQRIWPKTAAVAG